MEDRSLLASCNTDIPPCPKLYGRYFRKREEGGGPGDQGEPQPGEEPGAERRGRGNTGTSPDPSTGLARTLTSNVPGRRFCCSPVLYC